jgi:hypothetical protein
VVPGGARWCGRATSGMARPKQTRMEVVGAASKYGAHARHPEAALVACHQRLQNIGAQLWVRLDVPQVAVSPNGKATASKYLVRVA